jgi:hypothetical protein
VIESSPRIGGEIGTMSARQPGQMNFANRHSQSAFGVAISLWTLLWILTVARGESNPIVRKIANKLYKSAYIAGERSDLGLVSPYLRHDSSVSAGQSTAGLCLAHDEA